MLPVEVFKMTKRNGKNGRRVVDPTLGLGYVRVSTVEQRQSGLGIEAQRAALQNYAAMRGIVLVAILEDAGVSGSIGLADRPAGGQLAELLRRGKAGSVVALKLDRLFRNANDCLDTVERWGANGIALHVVDLGGNAIDTSSVNGKFMLTILAGVAEMERGLVRDRTAAALERKRARGEKTGGAVPFGFDAQGGRLVVNAEEARTVAIIRGLRQSGASLRKIADKLNSDGVATKQRGRQWYAEQVSSALRNAERFGVGLGC
jgi:DNA invertase Pin-like site-specific DNA recombinase